MDIARELGAIRQSLTDLKEDVTEIREQTTRTNGRVSELETDRLVAAAVLEANRSLVENRKTARRETTALAVGIYSATAAVFGSVLVVILAHFFPA